MSSMPKPEGYTGAHEVVGKSDQLVPTPVSAEERDPWSPEVRMKYGFVYPFLLYRVLPELSMDLITQCHVEQQVPKEVKYTTVSRPLFNFDAVGSDMNLPSNALLYVPKEDIETLVNFASSAVFFRGTTKGSVGSTWAVQVQKLCLTQGHSDPGIDVYAFCVQGPDSAHYWLPSDSSNIILATQHDVALGYHSQFSGNQFSMARRSRGDSKLPGLVDNFIEGGTIIPTLSEENDNGQEE